MTINLASRRVAFGAAGGLLAALTLGGGAQAVTDTIFQYTTAKTGYFSISYTAMAPVGTNSGDDYFSQVGPPGSIAGNSTNCFMTGVNLPDGARMTQVSVWTTSGAADDPTVYLLRNRLSDGAAHFLVNLTVVDDSTTRKQSNVALPSNHLAIVNNEAFIYGLVLCIGSGDLFHGARITYTYTNAGG